ncbi:hypothetical protein SAY86_017869 [Trapa natans]|uniref:Uncharacterized protein n=1 Tax=Trapa natans TaxID=22666 RepID=A0AAN7R715_TRANT|nr:hypothetical protein SAY86_017869 [Trapa natans]
MGISLEPISGSIRRAILPGTTYMKLLKMEGWGNNGAKNHLTRLSSSWGFYLFSCLSSCMAVPAEEGRWTHCNLWGEHTHRLFLASGPPLRPSAGAALAVSSYICSPTESVWGGHVRATHYLQFQTNFFCEIDDGQPAEEGRAAELLFLVGIEFDRFIQADDLERWNRHRNEPWWVVGEQRHWPAPSLGDPPSPGTALEEVLTVIPPWVEAIVPFTRVAFPMRRLSYLLRQRSFAFIMEEWENEGKRSNMEIKWIPL